MTLQELIYFVERHRHKVISVEFILRELRLIESRDRTKMVVREVQEVDGLERPFTAVK